MRSLVPWRERGMMEALRDEMDELFGRFFWPVAEKEGDGALRIWAPRVDVAETEKELVVKADLPGVGPKDVEVAIEEGSLIVRGEKKEEKEEKKADYHRTERYVGRFYREIPLPAGADPDKIAATSANGVITITIPKKAEALPKKIAVKPTD